MRFRSCLAGMLAVLITLGPAGAMEETSASEMKLHRLPSRQALLASLTGEAANRQAFLQEESEFCLTLDSPGIAEGCAAGRPGCRRRPTVCHPQR